MNDVVLSALLTLRSIGDARIDHVPNRLSYRAALRPKDVDDQARIHVETRNAAAIARLVVAIEETRAVPDERRSDLRYALRLRDARGITRATVYLDAFGTRGEIGGVALRFDSDAIKRAIVAIAPALNS